MLIEKLLGVLSGVTLAALVLALVGQITGQSLLSPFTGQLSGGPDQAPGQTNESFTPAQLPAVTEKLVVADRLTARQRETSDPSEVTGTASREPGTTSRETSAPAKETSPPAKETSPPPLGARTPANETGAPPKARTDQGASGGRPRLSATARPSASATAPSPEAATPKATPQFGGSHRAELVRKPVSRGWGASYAVRLLDPAGKPMVVADVLLVARMADGTVENIVMGALPEPGTYRGTVPTDRSTPVNLRIRVSTGDKFVEVPVRP
jgi:hypothetical protein